MRIKHTTGRFWNEDNNYFTQAECAATVYNSIDDLPCKVNDCLVEFFSNDDIRYYYEDDDANAVARVVR